MFGKRSSRKDRDILEDGGKHTNLIEFNGVVVSLQVVQQLLGRIAVWAVGFAEYGYIFQLAILHLIVNLVFPLSSYSSMNGEHLT